MVVEPRLGGRLVDEVGVEDSFFELGGPVLFFILAATTIMWTFIIERWRRFEALKREDLDDFVKCYIPEAPHLRAPTWSEDNPTGRWRAYDYEERYGRDYIGLGTTGGAWNPAAGRSMDQVALVTVDADGGEPEEPEELEVEVSANDTTGTAPLTVTFAAELSGDIDELAAAEAWLEFVQDPGPGPARSLARGNHLRQIHHRSLRCAEPFLMQVTPKAKAWLVEAGTDRQYGARPLKRTIQRLVQDPLARMVLAGEIGPGTTIVLDVEGDELVLSPRTAEPAA